MAPRYLVALAGIGLLADLAGCHLMRVRSAGEEPLHDRGPAGTWHVLGRGETAGQIAARAHIPIEDLLEINGLRRGDPVSEGRVLFVPDPHGLIRREHAPGAAAASGSVSQPPASAGLLRWPLREPRLTSPYGLRDGRPHEGIDLGAPLGTSVHAAETGSVLYAGNAVSGYGNMVILDHRNDLVTVYAHNSLLLVRTGDRVTAGQEIARVGQSGRATAPHLHFEVRRAQNPADPLRFLPPLPVTRGGPPR